jgi:hypothetical protein
MYAFFGGSPGHQSYVPLQVSASANVNRASWLLPENGTLMFPSKHYHIPYISHMYVMFLDLPTTGPLVEGVPLNGCTLIGAKKGRGVDHPRALNRMGVICAWKGRLGFW